MIIGGSVEDNRGETRGERGENRKALRANQEAL